MNEPVKSPESCQTMQDVRAGVDETDRQLVKLLETRFGYMRAAARIKQERGAVRDEVRKAAVIEAATQLASNAGLPANVIEDIWNRLVESSIAYELAEWDRIRS
ncbi:MAG: chorismate mutase [Pontixanthobacter sp.]